VYAYASILHVKTQLLANWQIVHYLLINLQLNICSFNETQTLNCQLSKSAALPTMTAILSALLKARNRTRGWTPAGWHHRHSWVTRFSCVQCKRANGAPAAAASFPRATKFTCKPSLTQPAKRVLTRFNNKKKTSQRTTAHSRSNQYSLSNTLTRATAHSRPKKRSLSNKLTQQTQSTPSEFYRSARSAFYAVPWQG